MLTQQPNLENEVQQRGWQPQARQQLFLESMAYEALYGGAKGGGKTDALLAEGCRQLDFENYHGAVFRREYPRLEEIIKRSHRWFAASAVWNEQKKTWTFPSGAKISFFHCENENDKYNHQGKEYQFIGFDQIEEFTETQYEFIKGCNRSSDPKVRCYIRATANPGNVGHAWVKKRFIDKLKFDGQIRFFKRINDEDTEVPRNTPGAQSRAFVFATVYDNAALLKADPNYLSTLQNLPSAYRKAFLEGNWDAFEGQFFSEWRKDVHVITYSEYRELAETRNCFRFIAGDYGFTNPSAIGWFAAFSEGYLIQYRELYKTGLTYEKLMQEILDNTPAEENIGYLVMDPAIQGDKQHHKEEKEGMARGESGLDRMEKVCADRFPILLGDNRRIVGWTRMHELLLVFTDQNNRLMAKLRYTENCRETIRTIPTLIHSVTNPEDVNTNSEDHPGDMNRYGIMSRHQAPKQEAPKETTAQRFWSRVKSDAEKNESNIDDEGVEIDDGGEEV